MIRGVAGRGGARRPAEWCPTVPSVRERRSRPERRGGRVDVDDLGVQVLPPDSEGGEAPATVLRSMATVLEEIVRLSARELGLIAAVRGGEAQVDPSSDKLAALLEVVGLLEAGGLPYALVGGVAVGLRSGLPRATLDTDLAVTTAAARSSVIELLTRGGFELRGEFTHTVNFRHRTGEPVQLMFDPAFDPMIARADTVQVGSKTIRVVTTEDLIAMKERAANDPARRRSKALRDLADAALLRGDIPDPEEGW